MTPNLSVHRRRLRRTMTSTCQITTPGSGQTFDPNTGTYVTGPPTMHYTGPCLVRAAPGTARVVQAGDVAVSLKTYEVWLPADTDVRVVDAAGNAYTLTVTGSTGDPALVGVPLVVLDVPLDDYQIARRVVARSA